MRVLSTCLSLLPILAGCGGSSAPGAPERPDIFLFTVDTLRADHLPMYGYERDTAPWLAEVAARGVVFEHAQSSSSWTVPGVASFLTGMMPHQLGIFDPPNEPRPTPTSFRVPDSAITLAERLKARGYATYAVTANAHLTEDMGYHQGFDEYHNVGWARLEKVDQALRPLIPEIRDRTGPVFVWIHLFDPHDPYTLRKGFSDRWTRDGPMRRELARSSMVKLRQRTDLRRGGPEIETLEGLYDAEIAASLAYLGEVAQELGVEDDDVLLFTSDHGEEFLEHGSLGHRYALFEETVRVPLVIAWPDQLPPGRVAERVSVCDVVPTLAEAGGAAIGPDSGVSLRSLLPEARGRERLTGPEVVADLTRRQGPRLRAIYQGDLKLIVVETEPEQVMLFDLGEDPEERHDLASQRPKVVEQMRNDLVRRFATAVKLEPQLMEGEYSAAMIEQLKAMGYLEPDEFGGGAP